MSDESILLFLHGIGDGDHAENWKIALDKTLDSLGYSGLDAARVIAPKYAHALKGWDEKQDVPAMTTKQPSREAAKRNRRDFERRMGAAEFRLGRHDRGNGYPGGDAAIGLALMHSKFVQARNYVQDAQVRAQVLNLVLSKLPESGRLVIVGHSLGSVIAADLVGRLPSRLKVIGMVTIGSPLANGCFDVDKLGEKLKDPPTNLAWWVNFWNAPDPVAAHRGVSSVFPWMVDFRINTKVLPRQAHLAVEYLADEAVGEAIGFALFGSKSKEVVRQENGLDVPLDAAEMFALLALRYSYLIKERLEGDVQDRYTGALRQVQATVVDGITTRNQGEGRPVPSAIARLEFDLSDPYSDVPEPLPSSHMAKDDAVIILTTLAAENIIRPFEIAIPKSKKDKKDIREEAMKDLTAEMGLGGNYGADVFTAAKLAHVVLSGGRGVNWVKWSALGAGAAALIVATGGLALAAGAGLAGAAVITSALASFGPGGMIGGLLTAGTLATAGGGGLAYGLASSGTSAETLEAVVERQLATEILRQRQRLHPNPAIWRILAQTEIEVRREHERLDEFSDETAPTLNELKRKIDAIERALKYLTENGLEPSGAPNSHDEMV
ncbi:lipase family protein [Arthrobacter sp. AQ5-05]|uniref:lipase family protein n=1 Tax=Arthrobacter sp. AQ5-05 TaxID=2184581 RepID=UPI0012B5B4AB|nr:alpha/beta fold hydrolase [Arthrobacter sp. AQ5-05]